MKVAILNYPDAILSSVIGPYDILKQTNGILESFGIDKNRKLSVEIVSTGSFKNLDIPEITSHTNIAEAPQYGLVIIPAMAVEKLKEVLEREKGLVAWLKKQYFKGAEVASICMGAFLLAETGILDGKCATTHWLGSKMFRDMYPQVTLVDHKIIAENDRVYTSGGAYSFTSLMIYLMEKFYGRQAAIILSKIFLIHIHDTEQITYSIFTHQKKHQDEGIKNAQVFIEGGYSKNLSLASMADKAKMSQRTFIRRFKKATGNTPFEYLQRVRVEKAKKLLEYSGKGIEEVCLEVGYEDFSAFRKVFKRVVGTTPNAYKKRYYKMFGPKNVLFAEN